MSSDFDESLLEENLKMTVEEWILAHDAALEVAREFEYLINFVRISRRKRKGATRVTHRAF